MFLLFAFIGIYSRCEIVKIKAITPSDLVIIIELLEYSARLSNSKTYLQKKIIVERLIVGN